MVIWILRQVKVGVGDELEVMFNGPGHRGHEIVFKGGQLDLRTPQTCRHGHQQPHPALHQEISGIPERP